MMQWEMVFHKGKGGFYSLTQCGDLDITSWITGFFNACIEQEEGGGRSTSYRLVNSEELGFGS
jgi:hypothetical protein